mmetsp:Transcript_37947/g.86862  ORF Transcript_37947/g.86862 Transcript_37947/m.86862 type:complete len:146 (+) Transcript_37947:3-440(+)
MGHVSMATKGTYGALLNILCYLRDTKDYSIHYGVGIDKKLRAYLLQYARDLRMDPWCDDSDVIWLADSSQGGERPAMCHIGFIAGTPYTWKTQRAKWTTLSSMESEYFAQTAAVATLQAHEPLYAFLGFNVTLPVISFCDNETVH